MGRNQSNQLQSVAISSNQCHQCHHCHQCHQCHQRAGAAADLPQPEHRRDGAVRGDAAVARRRVASVGVVGGPRAGHDDGGGDGEGDERGGDKADQ
eukprot:1151276-Prymnesium_polylepis.1